jgi:Ni,Fe-hydrogenase III large subunit
MDLETKINEIFSEVKLINQKIDSIRDHEIRIRKLETFMSKVTGALIIVSAALGSITTWLITKL